jgi:hypothetical protein
MVTMSQIHEYLSEHYKTAYDVVVGDNGYLLEILIAKAHAPGFEIALACENALGDAAGYCTHNKNDSWFLLEVEHLALAAFIYAMNN